MSSTSTVSAGTLPRVWGILNLTPDSFSDGGQFVDFDGSDSWRTEVLDRVLKAVASIVQAGADVLDVGGESTRPGSDPVSVEQEKQRVLPVLDALQQRGGLSIPISVDTRRAEVAALASERGATIVNDTSALRDDPELAAVVAERGLEVVLMHRQGQPRVMQRAPHYQDVIEDVRVFFEQRVEAAVDAGIPFERITLDPGFGFGKRPHDNDPLMAHLPQLRVGQLPFLIGASRKSFLARFDDRPAAQRLGGSLAYVAQAFAHGAEAVRVHDVADTVAFLRTLDALRRAGTIGAGTMTEALS